MRRKAYGTKVACAMMASALVLTSGNSVFAQEGVQSAAAVQSLDQTGEQQNSEIAKIRLEPYSVTKNHSTYEQLTGGSMMRLHASVYRKDGTKVEKGEAAQVEYELRKKDGTPSQAVCDMVYLTAMESYPQESWVENTPTLDVEIYAPYGYTEDLELVARSAVNKEVTATYSFRTVSDYRDGTGIYRLDTGRTVGNVKVGKTKQVWNRKKGYYTITLPKVTAKNKADQFVGWKDVDRSGKIYKAGEKVISYNRTSRHEFDAVWKTKTGTKFTVNENKDSVYALEYAVTGKNKVSLVNYTGLCKCIHEVRLPNTVEFHNQKFKVTSIGKQAITRANIGELIIGKYVTKLSKQAFVSDNFLNVIQIRSDKIKAVGANAMKGIKKDARIFCPAEKITTYKKMFRKAGLPKSVKFYTLEEADVTVPEGYDVVTSGDNGETVAMEDEMIK